MADNFISYDHLFSAPVITGMVSRVDTPIARFSNFYGLEPGGANREMWPGRHFWWDISDRSRNIARARAPYAGPLAISQKALGRQSAVAVRLHEKIIIPDERVFRSRPQGAQIGQVDPAGTAYVAEQTSYLAERFANAREFMVSRMFRGGVFYIEERGEDWVLTDSATNSAGDPNTMIDYGIPAENKSRIKDVNGNDILTDWNQSTADLLGQIMKIKQRTERDLGGHRIQHGWINSTLAQAILTNDSVKDVAGTANVTYLQYTPDGLRTVEGSASTGDMFVLRAIPWFTWHVYDGGLNTQGDSFGNDTDNWTSTIPDDYCIFTPDPSPRLYKMYAGSEWVRENVTQIGSQRMGMAAWSEPVTQPSGQELIAVENCLPVTFKPLSIFYGYVGA